MSKSETRWRVWYAIYVDFHDWIGPSKLSGQNKYQRRNLPPREYRDFAERAAAEKFVAGLRLKHGGEIVSTIVEVRRPQRSRPSEQMLLGD